MASSKAPSKSPDKKATPTAPANLTTTFPTGPTARRELRTLLRTSKDPANTIRTYQRTHSLHTAFSHAFSTTPLHELPSAKHSGRSSMTRAARQVVRDEREAGVTPEPFQPEPVLTFLTHLGVSRREVHKRIGDALRSALEDEIGRTNPRNNEALLNLLKSTWQFVSVAELRPVLVALIKKLGEGTPVPVLQRLAEKDSGGELKHGELLGQFGLPMRRLVWEADWERTNSSPDGGGDSETTLWGANLLCDLIRPSVEEYCADEGLKTSADLPFVAMRRERLLATQMRRAPPSKKAALEAAQSKGPPGSAAALAGTDAKSSATGDDSESKEKEKDEVQPSSGNALAKIREVVGVRPKLLGALLNMLIAEHGRSGTSPPSASKKSSLPEEKVLGGSSYLICALVSDILLTYGALPKVYEHVGILARVLDNCVKTGLVTDEALAQVQGCLRVVFQGDGDKAIAGKEAAASADKNKKGDAVGGGGKKEPSKSSKPPSGNPKRPTKEEERDFTLQLMRRVITAAVTAMKQSDPQGLFLNPVTDAIAPGYSDVIKEPMCIKSIEEKIAKLEYSQLSEYERDVQLMFRNCITYNIGKEGQWFRGEARRQQKVWRDDIMSQAKTLLRNEVAKRKRYLEKLEKEYKAEIQKEEKKRKREAMEKEKAAKAAGVAAAAARKKGGPADASTATSSSPGDESINSLTASDIDPLPPTKFKKRKKDGDHPSMAALATMILADPFVVRLLVDKVIRSLRADVLNGKTIPAAHRAVPSLMQLLHILQHSAQLCSIRGKKFLVPDAGLAPRARGGDDEKQPQADKAEEAGVPFVSLRRYMALLTQLLLESDLDKRMAPGGALHDAAVQVLPPRPAVQPDEWGGTSSLCSLRALVQGSLVHILQPGVSNEMSLRVQFPRFESALDGLSGRNMAGERPFFMSLIQALLRHKSKFAHGTRDMVAACWLKWLGGKEGRGGRKGTMTAPVHECFVLLLNEWCAFGNLVLPRDKLLSLAEDAVKAAEASETRKSRTYAAMWQREKDEFAPVKAQYERMLKNVPESHAKQWKEKMGIDDESLATLAKEVGAEEDAEDNKMDAESTKEKEETKDTNERPKKKIKISDRKNVEL